MIEVPTIAVKIDKLSELKKQSLAENLRGGVSYGI